MQAGTTRTRAMRWSGPGWRITVATIVVTALVGAASPRGLRWIWWPAGAGRRGLAAHFVVTTLVWFWLRELLGGLRAEHEAAVAEARARAGREPSESEVHTAFARRMLRRHLGREPTDEELERALRPDPA